MFLLSYACWLVLLPLPKLKDWSSSEFTLNFLFLLLIFPFIILTSVIIYGQMIPQIWMAGPRFYSELQVSVSNCLIDISTWMSQRYIHTNISNIIHNFHFQADNISMIPILSKKTFHQPRNLGTMSLLSHFPLSNPPDSVDSNFGPFSMFERLAMVILATYSWISKIGHNRVLDWWNDFSKQTAWLSATLRSHS